MGRAGNFSKFSGPSYRKRATYDNSHLALLGPRAHTEEKIGIFPRPRDYREPEPICGRAWNFSKYPKSLYGEEGIYDRTDAVQPQIPHLICEKQIHQAILLSSQEDTPILDYVVAIGRIIGPT